MSHFCSSVLCRGFGPCRESERHGNYHHHLFLLHPPTLFASFVITRLNHIYQDHHNDQSIIIKSPSHYKVRDLDPTNQLTFVRIASKKHEVFYTIVYTILYYTILRVGKCHGYDGYIRVKKIGQLG